MKVTITQSAKNSHFEIYTYHLDYSEQYADAFQYEIDEFIVQNLTAFPKLGHEYNKDKGLYRLIYDARYNVYYQLQGDEIFVLYVLDGQTRFNIDLLDTGIELPKIS